MGQGGRRLRKKQGAIGRTGDTGATYCPGIAHQPSIRGETKRRRQPAMGQEKQAIFARIVIEQ